MCAWRPFSQVLVDSTSPVSPLEQTVTSSMWPTWKWVMLRMHSCINEFSSVLNCSTLTRCTSTHWFFHNCMCDFSTTMFQYEPDCPDYPTERYTVDVDGVQVADLTADEVQSRVRDVSNGSMTLSLRLIRQLPENAMTVNMTKFITVPTNRSDDTGNIVTEELRTSNVFSEL